MSSGALNGKTGYLYECHEKVTRFGRPYHKRPATRNGERHSLFWGEGISLEVLEVGELPESLVPRLDLGIGESSQAIEREGLDVE